MHEEILEKIGLTKNETLAYLALLKIGKSKSSSIIREAKISSGKIYETLDKLVEKGLVKTLNENGVRSFIANDPKTLLEYLAEKEGDLFKKKTELEKILPELSKSINSLEKRETVSLVKGLRGIRPLVYEALEKCKSTILVMGVQSSKNRIFNEFWMNYHSRREKLKKKGKMLFSDRDTDYWKFFKKLKYTQVKETLSISPSSVMILDETVFIFSYIEKEVTCIHIISESVSSSFNNFFSSLWNTLN